MPTSETSTSSPMSQVTPESLNEVFNKDPELVTDEEITKIVLALQADRARFILTEKAPKVKAPKAKLDDSVTLEDLGL